MSRRKKEETKSEKIFAEGTERENGLCNFIPRLVKGVFCLEEKCQTDSTVVGFIRHENQHCSECLQTR